MQRTYPKTKVEISIVIPLYNEGENVEVLYTSLKEIVRTLDRETEIIFIDDGKYFAYPPVAGYQDLREALAAKYQKENNFVLKLKWYSLKWDHIT